MKLRQLARTLEGTKLEGKVIFKDSAPYGNDWSQICAKE